MSLQQAKKKQKPTLKRLYDFAPNKPYCTDDLGSGLFIRSKVSAFTRRYIQPNQPALKHWFVYDQDHEKIEQWRDANLPDPNFITRNLDNRKAHIAYAIEPVCVSDSARPKPIAYAAMIQEAYTEALGADNCYTGLITKNPYHKDWHVWEMHDHVYSLGELADYVDLKPRRWTRKRAANDNHYGLGRNCALFHRLRFWAYDNVTFHRENGTTFNEWMKVVLSRSETFNDFHEALPYNEVKSTAKSVGKWVWLKYWPEGKRVRRGVMGDSLKKSQIELDLTTKQRLSARRTNQIRKDATREKIIDAIGELTAQGKRVTKAAVSRMIGISDRALRKDYSSLFK